MKQSLKDFFEGTSIKKALFVIIWSIGLLGWTYFYQSYTITRAEANDTWSGHIERIENKKDDKEVSASAPVQPINPTGEPKNSPQGLGIEEIIYDTAKEKNFEDPEILVRIAKAESSLVPCAKNPHSSATGIFQILDMHGLSREERCNPRIATAWAIDHFNGGKPWASSKSKWQ